MRTALEQSARRGHKPFQHGSKRAFLEDPLRKRAGNGGQNRIEVCYKTTPTGAQDPGGVTSTWRDPAGANKPENALLGVDVHRLTTAPTSSRFTVRAADGADTVYRKTNLQNQPAGSSTSIGSTLVGWEWDARVANGFEPAGVKTLSASAVSGNIGPARDHLRHRLVDLECGEVRGPERCARILDRHEPVGPRVGTERRGPGRAGTSDPAGHPERLGGHGGLWPQRRHRLRPSTLVEGRTPPRTATCSIPIGGLHRGLGLFQHARDYGHSRPSPLPVGAVGELQLRGSRCPMVSTT